MTASGAGSCFSDVRSAMRPSPRGAAQLTRPLDVFQRSPVCHQMMRPGAISTAWAAVRQLDRRGSFVGFERRFPPPWTTEETDGCFIVKDRNGQKLAYADERPHTYSPATRHGARIAVNVAKLPEPLSRSARISGA